MLISLISVEGVVSAIDVVSMFGRSKDISVEVFSLLGISNTGTSTSAIGVAVISGVS